MCMYSLRMLLINYPLLFAFSCFVVTTTVQSKTDEQVLAEWTGVNEAYLLDHQKAIRSSWFENECLQLAKSMSFNKINQCRVLDSNHINAYVLNNGHVYFSLGLLKNIRNKHQWAAILAHENAHIELNHYLKNLKKIKNPGVFFPKLSIKKAMRKHEQQADQWSYDTLKRYGFDVNQIAFFLQRAKKITKGKIRNTHIKLSKRIKKNQSSEIIDMMLMENISMIQAEN